jgi:hypothetical protein
MPEITKLHMAKTIATALYNLPEFVTENNKVPWRYVKQLMRLKKEHLQSQYDKAFNILSDRKKQSKKVQYYANEVNVFAELLRRYICFHNGEDMHKIELWGLADYGVMNPLREKGYVLSDYKKENKTCWFKPTETIINEVIKPAYELYKKDTGVHGHDIYSKNYTEYIYEVTKGGVNA